MFIVPAYYAGPIPSLEGRSGEVLFALHAGIFFLRLRLNSSGRLNRVILFDVRRGGRHRPPGLTARHADPYCDNSHND